jgi:DNA polymerase III epsilon subunit-like protein
MVAPNLTSRQQAIQVARQVLAQNPVYLDTETTGLEKTDEVVEITILDPEGQVLLNSLVRPSQPIPAGAERIHGISNEMVQKAPAWPILWQQIRPLLIGKTIVAYNSDYDHRLLQQSHARYKQPWRDSLKFFDLLKLYSQFRGEWDANRRSWRYFSLDAAGKACGIPLPNAHRATADTLLTRALLHFIAGQGA